MAEAPDLTRPPNFDALRAWFDKLEAWCKAVVEEYGDHDLAIEARDNRIADLEHDLVDVRHDNEQYEKLVEAIRDVERGIRTLDEVYAMLPSIHR